MSTFKNIKVGIIDYKLNNLFSIYNALRKIGYKTNIIDLNVRNYKTYDLVVLPGVGSYSHAMDYIKKFNIDKKIYDFISKKESLLFGICLGMQLLFEESSEFKNTKGLGIISGFVENLKNDKKTPVPHIGWNNLINLRNNDLRIKKKNFYFIHSLYCKPKDKKVILTETKYGKNNFCSSIYHKNIFATQFHPEKSGHNGIELLKQIKNMI